MSSINVIVSFPFLAEVEHNKESMMTRIDIAIGLTLIDIKHKEHILNAI